MEGQIRTGRKKWMGKIKNGDFFVLCKLMIPINFSEFS